MVYSIKFDRLEVSSSLFDRQHLLGRLTLPTLLNA